MSLIQHQSGVGTKEFLKFFSNRTRVLAECQVWLVFESHSPACFNYPFYTHCWLPGAGVFSQLQAVSSGMVAKQADCGSQGPEWTNIELGGAIKLSTVFQLQKH